MSLTDKQISWAHSYEYLSVQTIWLFFKVIISKSIDFVI